MLLSGIAATARRWTRCASLSAFLVLIPSIVWAQQLTLTWTDHSGGKAYFVIERSAYGGTYPYRQVAQTPLGATKFVDQGISWGIEYCYKVAAVKASGRSAFTGPVCAVPYRPRYSLTIVRSGPGKVSSPSGILCPTVCVTTVLSGGHPTLTAIPSTGALFVGWSGGGCTGSATTCITTVKGPVTITATFKAIP